MKKPLIVIGHRLGKGQNVAVGVTEAGGEAFVISGFTADMKLGDVMKEKSADLGISFCGSGGAGAIHAANQHGFTQKHSLRTVLEGVGAVNEGIKVLGFGFMDTKELGFEITKAWIKKHG